MKERKKLSLATWIFISLALGIVVGIFFMGNPTIADAYIKPFGTIFLNLVKFIVVPVVLFSIISGVISMKDIKKVGSIGIKTVIFYLCTTACAIIVGLFFANLFKGSFTVLETSNLAYEVKGSTSLSDTIIGIFPSNIASPFVNANMLQIIVIALFFGFGIILAGEKGKPAATLVESLNEVSMQIMAFIIKLSPIGVFSLIAPVVATNGPQILGSLAKVLLVAYLCYIIHVVVVYSSTVKFMGGLSPMKFFKGMMPSMMFAFSSASSVGTLPLNLECCQKLGAKKDIASFVLPLGATINMDGTAIYQGVCAVFIATCFGVSLTPAQMLTIVLTGTLASIGTAGVPGAGMIMLSMVLQSVGLPIEGIALVAGVDRIFDMGRTVVNITGDAACSIVVSNIETKKEENMDSAPADV
ncbi:MAG: dicarboxylate/amino acid:cation symporter [Clostridium sp.]|uniref:dicarboxylate/amino acid:cation symporter n=1 Tax=Clostridium sp. TaxID=1506 RepID=UPI002A8B094B|nr:dicarboxylate/amino acid:cation symporter [Clostridium sp.]MDY5098672.1 dicarboxylate/amino acid:cation symporter [Clostridium sp.]